MTIRVSPRGTRGAGFPPPLMKIFKLFGGQQIRMFRRDGGQSMSSRMGFPLPPTGDLPLGDRDSPVIVTTRLGGLLREYSRAAA